MAEQDKINKGDFIEIEFTGTIPETGEIFDTNIKEDAEKSDIKAKETKPYIMAVGHGMLIKGFDRELQGKQTGKQYKARFNPEEAFGERQKNMVKMIPSKMFHEQNIQPQRGMQLSLDGRLVRILSVSGGRVLVDFNNPLAGKEVEYKYKIKRKITDENEKINALQDFFFRRRFDFETKNNNKTIIFKIPKSQENSQSFVKMMEKGFNDILNMNVETEIIQDKKKDDKKHTTTPQ